MTLVAWLVVNFRYAVVPCYTAYDLSPRNFAKFNPSVLLIHSYGPWSQPNGLSSIECCRGLFFVTCLFMYALGELS